MKNVAAAFTADELAYIKKHTGILLSDEKEYSDDDFLDIHKAITENAPYDDMFECVVDKFYDKFGI